MVQTSLFGEPETPKPSDKKKVHKPVQPAQEKLAEKIEPEIDKPLAEPHKPKNYDTPPATTEIVAEDIPTQQPERQEAPRAADKVNTQDLQKVYYTITEVAKMFDVNASLLRFWEKEFRQLGKIKKNKKGDRYYNKENIRHLNIIYYLLREQKMTIAGARDMIKNKRKSTAAQFDLVENLQKIKGFLVDLKTELEAK